ncbi:DUF5817 domain-containing protein [Halomicroarcula sp. GCM10025817]|uniref:DUF5817 domain-containing protein n=1 Tax=Haloarcula TaxID=2237 RepID=UPI0023E8CC34|nr:DUF5817 domain-containing protein [Halomicroarcula sp. SYNS111]
MYAVVGCSECSALWVVEGRPETTRCPRCGTRKQHAKRRKFVETDDEAHAREVRASMLANRQGEGDAFAQLDSYADLDRQVESSGIDDETYLESSGIDSEAVAAAGERAEGGARSGSSRKETVRAALRDLDDPTEDAVVAYASERDVPADYTRTALEKLRRAGEVTESGGTYRLL